MSISTSPYPALSADTTGTSIVSQAGAVLLLRTAEKTGLTTALSQQLTPWRKPMPLHDPAKIILDLAISLAIGGDCLAGIALTRCCDRPVLALGGQRPDPPSNRLPGHEPR